MDWVDLLRIGGFVLLALGGWSVTDSLARIAKAMETKAEGASSAGPKARESEPVRT